MCLPYGSNFEPSAGLYFPAVDDPETGGTVGISARWIEPVLSLSETGSLNRFGCIERGNRSFPQTAPTQTWRLPVPEMQCYQEHSA